MEAINSNFNATRGAFNITDAHLSVLLKVCKDLSCNRVKRTEEFNATVGIPKSSNAAENFSGEPIDLKYYYDSYNTEIQELQRKIDADAAAKKEEENKQVIVPAEIAESPVPTNVEIFGGNLG